MTNRVEFDTSEFRRSHGKEPRGSGHWGFFFDDAQNVEDAFWANGSFAEAKRMAMAWAVTKGHRRVRVAP